MAINAEKHGTFVKVNAVATPKKFTTGSVGWFTNGKIEIGGQKYQTNVQAVLIGSKGLDLPAPADAATINAVLSPKAFHTGSVGYFTSDKATVNGLECQVQVQMVLVGSSDKAAEKLAEKAAKAAQQAADAEKALADKRADREKQLLTLKASIGVK